MNRYFYPIVFVLAFLPLHVVVMPSATQNKSCALLAHALSAHLHTDSVSCVMRYMDVCYDWQDAHSKHTSLRQHQAYALGTISSQESIAGADGSIIDVYSMANTSRSMILAGHKKHLSVLGFFSDHLLISGFVDGTINVWSMQNVGRYHSLKRDVKSITALAVCSRDRLVTGSLSGNIDVWDLRSSKYIASLVGNQSMISCLQSFAGDRLASGNEAGRIVVYDMRTYEAIMAGGAHAAKVSAITVLPGNRFISGSVDSSLYYWKPQVTTQLIYKFSPDGRIELRPQLYLQYNPNVMLPNHKHPVVSVAVLSDGNVVSCDASGYITIWDLENEQSLVRIDTHCTRVTLLRVLDNGSFALLHSPSIGINRVTLLHSVLNQKRLKDSLVWASLKKPDA